MVELPHQTGMGPSTESEKGEQICHGGAQRKILCSQENNICDTSCHRRHEVGTFQVSAGELSTFQKLAEQGILQHSTAGTSDFPSGLSKITTMYNGNGNHQQASMQKKIYLRMFRSLYQELVYEEHFMNN